MDEVILTELKEKEGHTRYDLLKYLIEYYPNGNPTNTLYIQERIEDLLDHKFITLTDETYMRMSLFGNFESMQGHINLKAAITISGKEFLYKRETNKIQRKLNSVVATATVIATIISVCTLLKDCSSLSTKINNLPEQTNTTLNTHKLPDTSHRQFWIYRILNLQLK